MASSSSEKTCGSMEMATVVADFFCIIILSGSVNVGGHGWRRQELEQAEGGTSLTPKK
jgi:hypothetical protein